MSNSLIERKDFYYDEDGLIVFTEQYHLSKGVCCGNGCKHCPYNYENVIEQKTIQLIKNEKK